MATTNTVVRRGRPRLPRDANGNIVRPQASPAASAPVSLDSLSARLDTLGQAVLALLEAKNDATMGKSAPASSPAASAPVVESTVKATYLLDPSKSQRDKAIAVWGSVTKMGAKYQPIEDAGAGISGGDRKVAFLMRQFHSGEFAGVTTNAGVAHKLAESLTPQLRKSATAIIAKLEAVGFTL